MPASSIAPSAVDSAAYDELDQLMREFPDWKETHPELAGVVNPPRYPKNKSGGIPGQHAGELKVLKRSQTVPVTDYRASYKNFKVRPRSNKRPPPTPMDPNPPPMNFHTNQRDEFKPKRQERVKPIVKEDEYEPPNEKFDLITRYRSDFPAKSVELPKINVRATQATIKKSDHPLSGTTTNMEHYKSWGTKPATAFRDVPVFTGSLLYPDQNRYMTTTTNATFQGEKGARAPLIKRTEGNLSIEGGTDFHTVNEMTYQGQQGEGRTEMVVQKPELVVQRRIQFDSKTQTQEDYANKSAPARTRAVAPAQPTIDLRFDNSLSHDTEQRMQFKGVDAKRHPAPKPFKLEDNTELSTDKMETMTSQKRDFQPFDVSAHPPAVAVARSEPKLFNRANMPKLDSNTTNRVHYKPWNIDAPKRYDDFYEASMYARRDIYVPPTEKFSGVTTNSDTYKGKFVPVPSSLKPQDKPVQKLGQHDFNTIYNVQFHSPSIARRLEKQQAAGLLKELRRRKLAPQGTQIVAK